MNTRSPSFPTASTSACTLSAARMDGSIRGGRTGSGFTRSRLRRGGMEASNQPPRLREVVVSVSSPFFCSVLSSAPVAVLVLTADCTP